MEDKVWALLAEDALHALLVGDARHIGVGLDVGEVVEHHQPYVVLRRLGLVDEYELFRFELRHLPHHLRTNASCRAGDKDAPSLEHGPYGPEVYLYLVAWQQVLNLHLMELHALYVLLVLCPALRHSCEVYLHALADEHVLQGDIIAELVGLSLTDEHRLDMQVLDVIGQLLLRLVDLLSKQYPAFVVLVMRYEALELELCRLDVPDVLRQTYALVADTVDECAQSFVRAEGHIV